MLHITFNGKPLCSSDAIIPIAIILEEQRVFVSCSYKTWTDAAVSVKRLAERFPDAEVKYHLKDCPRNFGEDNGGKGTCKEVRAVLRAYTKKRNSFW